MSPAIRAKEEMRKYIVATVRPRVQTDSAKDKLPAFDTTLPYKRDMLRIDIMKVKSFDEIVDAAADELDSAPSIRGGIASSLLSYELAAEAARFTRAALKSSGFKTVRSFAKRAGLNDGRVSAIMNGAPSRPPSLGELGRIARASGRRKLKLSLGE